MPLELLLEIEQQARESATKTAESLRLDGATDAALGLDISSRDAAYLDGYFGELRERIERGKPSQFVGCPQMQPSAWRHTQPTQTSFNHVSGAKCPQDEL